MLHFIFISLIDALHTTIQTWTFSVLRKNFFHSRNLLNHRNNPKAYSLKNLFNVVLKQYAHFIYKLEIIISCYYILHLSNDQIDLHQLKTIHHTSLKNLHMHIKYGKRKRMEKWVLYNKKSNQNQTRLACHTITTSHWTCITYRCWSIIEVDKKETLIEFLNNLFTFLLYNKFKSLD